MAQKRSKDDLRRFQHNQDRVYVENILYPNTRQTFSDFLSWHPNLYNNYNLTTAEIDFINRHFKRYMVEPQTFEDDFHELLDMCLPRYLNMKSIELVDQVFDITTNNSVRDVTQDTVNELSRNADRVGNQTSTNKSDNKQANRQLPNRTTGTNFDEIVNWHDGASLIGETKVNGEDKITSNDVSTLRDLGNSNVKSKDKYQAVNEQAVILVSRIWNYLLAPKSTDYLINALSQAFILVY